MIAGQAVEEGIRRATLKAAAVPVLCGSALKNKGVCLCHTHTITFPCILIPFASLPTRRHPAAA